MRRIFPLLLALCVSVSLACAGFPSVALATGGDWIDGGMYGSATDLGGGWTKLVSSETVDPQAGFRQGPFSKLGGYRTEFQQGFASSVRFKLARDTATNFTLSAAINQQGKDEQLTEVAIGFQQTQGAYQATIGLTGDKVSLPYGSYVITVYYTAGEGNKLNALVSLKSDSATYWQQKRITNFGPTAVGANKGELTVNQAGGNRYLWYMTSATASPTSLEASSPKVQYAYSLSYTGDAGVTNLPKEAQAVLEDTQVRYTPKLQPGKIVDSVKVNGLAVTAEADGSYTFTMPSKETVVSITTKEEATKPATSTDLQKAEQAIENLPEIKDKPTQQQAQVIAKAASLYAALSEADKEKLDAEQVARLDEQIGLLPNVTITSEHSIGEAQVQATGLGLAVAGEAGKGETVAIAIAAKLLTAQDEPQAGALDQKAEALLGGKATTPLLMDLSVIMTKDGKKTELKTPGNIQLAIQLPEALRGRAPYAVYTVHNGAIKQLASTLSADGKSLMVTMDAFSTLAVYGSRPPRGIVVGAGSGASSDGSSGTFIPNEEREEEQNTPQWRQVTCRRLNLRQGPGTSFSRIGQLRRGDMVQVLSVADGWAKIIYNGSVGYVSESYLIGMGGQVQGQVSCRTLNVRQGPGTRYDRKGQLSRGDRVTILSQQDGWARIAWGNGEAYVSANYLI